MDSGRVKHDAVYPLCAFWIGINVEGHALTAGSVASNDGILTVAEDDVPFFIWPDGSSGWHGWIWGEKGPRPGVSILYLPYSSSESESS